MTARPLAAQDITILVVAIAPPILGAPFCLAVARWVWARRHPSSNLGVVKILLLSCLDIVLWLTFLFSAGTLLTGDFHRAALPVAPIALGLLWLLSKFWVDPSQTRARWFHLALPPMMLVGLAAITWMLILAFEPKF